MITVLIIEVAGLIVLLGCSAFFSSSEIAYFSLNNWDVKRLSIQAPHAKERICNLLSDPKRLLAAILTGNTIVNVGASSLGFEIAESLAPGRGEALSIPVMLILVLVFGEIGPKRFAVIWRDRLVVIYAPLLSFWMTIAHPLQFILAGATKSFETSLEPASRALNEEEFKTVVRIGEEAGVLDADERAMVHAIISLEDRKASDVMTPRVDIQGIDLLDPPADITRHVRSSYVRHLLLFRDHVDQVEGLLDTRQYLLMSEPSIQGAWIPPYYVPETARLDQLLATFQHEGILAAVVVDEYGGTAGLITRGDILEEITGELANEFAEGKTPEIEPLGRQRWLVDGSVSLEELNEKLDCKLDADGVDRLAGWIHAHAEHLPRAGEVIEAQGCRVTVQRVKRHRIELVLFEKMAGTTNV